MTGLVAFIGAACLVAAALAVGVGLRRTTAPRRPRLPPAVVWARWTRRPAGAGRRRDLLLAVSIAVGVAVAAVTGWLIAIPAAPLALVVVPKLFGQAPPNDLALMEALDRWVRSITVSLPVGRDVVQAIRVSRPGAPPLIGEAVGQLVDRLDRRVPPADALQLFADRLDSPEADAVVASLKLATARSEGLRDTLLGIADAIQERIRSLREVEIERDKQRGVARAVTVLSALMLTVAGINRYLDPYGSPVGQVLISVLAAMYVGSLLVMHRMTVPRRRARILVAPAGRVDGRVDGGGVVAR